MNELFKITTNEQGSDVVSARDVYTFLDVKTPFEKWITRMFEYGFTELVDYQQLDKVVQIGNGAKRTVVDDYALTLDCAKEIGMLQRSEKGKQVRLYFIEYEKQHRHLATKPMTQLEVLSQAIQLLTEQERRVTAVELTQAEQGEAIRMLEARTTTRPDYFTVVGYANLNNISLGLKAASSVGQKASRICKERGLMMETIPDPRFGQVRMYPRPILVEVFSQPIV